MVYSTVWYSAYIYISNSTNVRDIRAKQSCQYITLMTNWRHRLFDVFCLIVLVLIIVDCRRSSRGKKKIYIYVGGGGCV